jgi:hypothetical protein
MKLLKDFTSSHIYPQSLDQWYKKILPGRWQHMIHLLHATFRELLFWSICSKSGREYLFALTWDLESVFDWRWSAIWWLYILFWRAETTVACPKHVVWSNKTKTSGWVSINLLVYPAFRPCDCWCSKKTFFSISLGPSFQLLVWPPNGLAYTARGFCILHRHF